MIQRKWKNFMCYAITLVIAVFIIICLQVVRAIMGTKSPNVICTSMSENGEYGVAILSYDEPDFFAPHRVGIKIYPQKINHPSGIDILQFDVANDGGTVKAKDITFQWNGDSVTITILASEQADIIYKVSFFDNAAYILERYFEDRGTVSVNPK